ncbi:MAG TPA: MFS transporter [Mycobacteriales bacterium]|nr:MFS transporter [Mycobacteriales bacterium]
MSTQNHPDLPSGGPPEAVTPEAAGSAGSPRVGRVAGAVIAAGFVSFFTDISSEMVTAVLPLFLILQVGLTPLQYGVVDGLYQGVSVAVRLVGGYFADRWRRPKLVCLLGYGLSIGTKLALLRVGSASSTSLVVAVDRTGKGLRTAPRDAIIAASSARQGLGRAFGVHRAMDTAGAMIGPLLAFAILAEIPNSFGSVFVTSFWVAVVGLAVLVLFVPDLRLRATGGAVASLRGALGLVADRRVLALLLTAAPLAALTVSDGFVYLTLQQRLSVTNELFPLFAVGMSAAYLLLAVPAGRLADRVGRWRVFLAGHVLLLVGYLCLLLTSAGLLTAAVCLGMLGCYYACTDGVLAAAVAELLPDHLRGSGIALVQSAVAGGRLVSSVLFGLLWTVLGGQTPALVCFTVALALDLPLAWLLMSRTGRRPVFPVRPGEPGPTRPAAGDEREVDRVDT